MDVDKWLSWVLPASRLILSPRCAVQRKGTAAGGKVFGPIMALWFSALAAAGLPGVLANPEILGALSPHHALLFVVRTPWVAFIALGAVVLVITGTEALYADMGHFGRGPILLAWFILVLPCLTVCYMGMGAMILLHPDYVDNPFFRLAPDWAKVPMVVLATMASVIASPVSYTHLDVYKRQPYRCGPVPRRTCSPGP